MPTRDYTGNFYLMAKAAGQNQIPHKTMDYPGDVDGRFGWLLADGGFRRSLADVNGTWILGDYNIPAFWFPPNGGYAARHNDGANFLFRDGRVQRLGRP
jgi:prepilin-type processing-associated H-X9-DG protein